MLPRYIALALSVGVAAAASGLLAANAKATTEQETYRIITRAIESAQAVPYVPVEKMDTEAMLVKKAESKTRTVTTVTYQKSAERVQLASAGTPSEAELMRRISWCESRWRQFDENGRVLRGEVDPRDSGKFQVNTYYHLTDSLKLGLDIFTEAGNEAYAWHLLRTKGTRPWEASRYCWSSEEVLKEREYPGLIAANR
jgi:hypothetical protein